MGCQSTWGGRGRSLTCECEVELQALPRLWVLTHHLLEVDMGDLDQVPCGEAALIPEELIDGTCGDADSVSPFGKALGGLCPCSSHTLLTVPPTFSASFSPEVLRTDPGGCSRRPSTLALAVASGVFLQFSR